MQRNKLEESLREEKINPPSVPRLEGSRTPIEKKSERKKKGGDKNWSIRNIARTPGPNH